MSALGQTAAIRQRMLNYLQRLILIWPFNASPYDSLLQLHVPRRNLYFSPYSIFAGYAAALHVLPLRFGPPKPRSTGPCRPCRNLLLAHIQFLWYMQLLLHVLRSASVRPKPRSTGPCGPRRNLFTSPYSFLLTKISDFEISVPLAFDPSWLCLLSYP